MPRRQTNQRPAEMPNSPSSIMAARLIAATIIILAGIFLLYRWQNHYAGSSMRRELRIEELRKQALSLAKILSENIYGVVSEIDDRLSVSAQIIERPLGPSSLSALPSMKGQLRNIVVQTSWANRDGVLIGSNNFTVEPSKISVAERKHFKVHWDGEVDGLYISEPTKGALTGIPSLIFTKAIKDRSGAFEGVIAMTVDVDRISKSFSEMGLPEGAFLSVVGGSDHIIRLRVTSEGLSTDAIGQVIPPDRPYVRPGAGPEGSFYAESFVDGGARVYGWNLTAEYNLFALIALPVAAALAEVESRNKAGFEVEVLISSLTTVLIFFLLSTLWLIQRSIQANLTYQASILAQVHFDALTKVYSRQYILEMGEQEFLRYQRFARPVSVLMLDLDFFKRINDRYGHAAGDAVLTEFGRLLISVKRGIDLAGRIGGEEFCLVLPDTDIKGATLFAERIRQKTSELIVPFDQDDIRFTVSIGLVEIGKTDQDFRAAMERADKCLYAAKAAGRNRVISGEGISGNL